jgi:DNA-directed RNA polymerase specialized sigma subunit
MAPHRSTARQAASCPRRAARDTRSAAGSGRKPQAPRQLNEEQRQFAVTHLNLARQQARRFAARHGMVYEEVLGAAYEGLCKAALGFERERGHRPSSYVVPKVRGELLHHLRDTGFLLRISHRMRELWLRARRPLALGHSDGEIAQMLAIPLQEWLEVRRACGLRPVPLREEQEEDRA